MTQKAEFRIRPALPADASLVSAIDEASGIVHAPHVPALIAELLPLRMSWIAEADGVPAGYAVVSRRFYSRPFIELLAVAPDFRRAGVGGALLKAWAAAFEGETLFTSTNRSNEPMQALLAKTGFEPSGIIENLDPADPELVYVRLPRSAGVPASSRPPSVIPHEGPPGPAAGRPEDKLRPEMRDPGAARAGA